MMIYFLNGDKILFFIFQVAFGDVRALSVARRGLSSFSIATDSAEDSQQLNNQKIKNHFLWL